MAALELSRAVWRKSRRSNGQGECLELAVVPAAIVVRDSKNSAGDVLAFAPADWTAFLGAVKRGRFDL